MSAEAIAPLWMHELVTAEQYDSWSPEQCAGIEIVDGMVVVSPSASKRHWRIEQALTGVPIVYTYVLDLAITKYRETEVFTGVVKATAPFPVTIDLTKI